MFHLIATSICMKVFPILKPVYQDISVYVPFVPVEINSATDAFAAFVVYQFFLMNNHFLLMNKKIRNVTIEHRGFEERD